MLFPVIDGCLDLRERHALAADRIVRVTVRGHPLLRMRTDRPDVTTGREAKVSLQHSVAVAFLYGAAGLAQASCQIRELRLAFSRSMAASPSIRQGAALGYGWPNLGV